MAQTRAVTLDDAAAISLINLPPTSQQNWTALAVAAILFVGFLALVPVVDTPLPPVESYILILVIGIFVTDLITSILLFSQLSIYYSFAILTLASGYLFTALIVIPYALAFPGIFSPTGLFGASFQSSPWLYRFWHVGFPASVLIYAWLKDEHLKKITTRILTRFAITLSVAIVVGLVCGLAWIAILGGDNLPVVLLDNHRYGLFTKYLSGFNVFLCGLAVAVLWVRRRSVLDLWITVVVFAWMLEILLAGVFSSARFSLGFYVGRSLALVTATIVLVVLLSEITTLYARIAHTNRMLQRERHNKLMTLEAVAASISHEVRQPLTAIATSGNAALRFLGHEPPDLERARSALGRVVANSHRTSQIFDNMRSLFGKAEQRQEQIDINGLAHGVLQSWRVRMNDRGISTRVEFVSELPVVGGHRGQLEEVLNNVVSNAIEAMDTVGDERRLLQVRTERHSRDAIVVEVEDSGPGIDPEKINNIFDAFFTTKAHGMGLGLAICRAIIEDHGGQLLASSAQPRGAIFQIVLPIQKLGMAR
jgi:signal transduction histidine kinase